MNRNLWVWIHRWSGLTMAAFLVVVGLTGSLLAFRPQLERRLSPDLFVEGINGAKLDAASLALRAEELVPQARARAVYLHGHGGLTYVVMDPGDDSTTGRTHELGFDQLILDPYTGAELARRRVGALSEGLINLMPFIYDVHFKLAAGTAGYWIISIVAVIWTIDCFIGFYLTLPSRRRRPLGMSPPGGGVPIAGFWRRWKPAWGIKCTNRYRLNFDLHRAGGLWLWPLLLVFAWSSVYLNLWDTVYTPITRLALDYREVWTELSERRQPVKRVMSWREAQRVADALIGTAGSLNGFKVEEAVALRLDRRRGFYTYYVRSSRDVVTRGGMTRVFFDADTGAQLLLLLPTGQYAGNTLTSWLAALHMANTFGVPYQIVVVGVGAATAMLPLTGIVIWLKKRRARVFLGRRRSPSGDVAIAAASSDAV